MTRSKGSDRSKVIKGAEQSTDLNNGQQPDKDLYSDPTVAAVKTDMEISWVWLGRHAWPKRHIAKHKAWMTVYEHCKGDMTGRTAWPSLASYQGVEASG